MNKKDLIFFLKQGLNTEERAMPVYTKHLDSTLFFSGFDKKLQEKIKNTLVQLKNESNRHEEVFRMLIEKVENSRRNVY